MFAGDDKRIKIWELTQGTLLKELRGHTDTVHALAFNRDNTTLASGEEGWGGVTEGRGGEGWGERKGGGRVG